MAKKKFSSSSVEETKTKTNGNGKVTANGPYTDYVLQFVIIFSLILPWFFINNITGKNVDISEFLTTMKFPKGIIPIKDVTDWIILMITLSTPHVFYYNVWTNAKKWDKLCKDLGFKESYIVFANCAHAIKLQQAICFIVWYFGGLTATIQFLSTLTTTTTTFQDVKSYTELKIQSIHPYQLLLGTELVLLGQLFNVGVYYAIGDDGVYYGCRLGHKIPWVYGFPFSVIAHPQYRGATISIFGFAILFATSDSIDRGIYAVSLIMSAYYTFSGYVEEHL